MSNRKTKEVSRQSDWTCPVHKKTVVARVRTKVDDKGSNRYLGSYYACPDYHECRYYVSPNGRAPIL